MEIRPQRRPALASHALPATRTASLKAAKAHLTDLSDQLEQAKIEALLGIHYDADEYDTLVFEFRRARDYVQSLRRLALQVHAFAAPTTAAQPDLAA